MRLYMQKTKILVHNKITVSLKKNFLKYENTPISKTVKMLIILAEK